MKKLTKLAVFFIVLGFSFILGNNSTVHAQYFEDCNVPTLNRISDFNNISAGYVQKVSTPSSDKTGVTSYFKFTLNADSWVKFSGSYSFNNHDGGQTHINIFSDASLSNKKGEYGWGYWEYTNEFTGFLTKGTYYASINTKHANYQDDFNANVNVIAGAIPVSRIFNFSIKASSKQTSATVNMTDTLGSYIRCVQYRKGSVSSSYVNSNQYWKYHITGEYYGGSDDATLLTVKNNKYSFKATKNGSYTVLIEDINGNRYSKVVKVKQIDDVKPTVTGVKNKKTYKKAVKIKFYDKGSGIKSAKLNGKTIKSGKKVSKAGTYKLVVTDKAGNKTSIRFYIKK